MTKLFAEHPFNSKSPYGFVVGTGDGESYRYLWRSRVYITKLDDEGEPAYEQVESVGFTDFSLLQIEGAIFLRIENAGKNIRDLLNSLETLIGMGFTAKPVTFESGRPTAVFHSVDSVKLVGLKVVGAVVADDLVARMEFASKEGMDIQRMEILSNLKYKVDNAVFEVVFEGIRGQISFSANGSVKISGQIAPRLIHFVEKDLPQFI
ncbi:hypothetical protein ABN448_05535 [Delftia acidovorans]|uniref:hypothetical protein n=1 Tax=Delftia acidovorans TaxID=80866 RepID=UPI0032DF9DDE